jgi:hypothetical protein
MPSLDDCRQQAQMAQPGGDRLELIAAEQFLP